MIRLFLHSALLIGMVSVAYAQPTVTLTAEARDNFHSVLFTFIQNDLPSMEGCHYNLFAAGKASDLETLPGNGLSIATFFRAVEEIQIIASPLPHLARLSGKNNPRIRRNVKVYFRTLLSCPEGNSGLGEIISVSMKTFTRGKLISVSRLTKKMKYNMQYYTPS